jgi:formate hydrogenlyase subunit 3/multisubunit Na+/H+ antiporter MnhD subunit
MRSFVPAFTEPKAPLVYFFAEIAELNHLMGCFGGIIFFMTLLMYCYYIKRKSIHITQFIFKTCTNWTIFTSKNTVNMYIAWK